MRIVVDVSPLTHPRTGIGNYVRGALNGLAQASGGEHDVVAFAPASDRGATMIREALAGIPVDLRVKTLPFAHAWRLLWSAVRIPTAERFLGSFDVLHLSDWMQPPQRNGIRAATIHDLAPIEHPEWAQRRTRALHRRSYRDAARSDVVFAVSEHTARDAVDLLSIPRERIRIAHPGVDERFRPEGERADLGRPYVLSVATNEPRKNLHTLLEGHALLRDAPALALSGATGWGGRLSSHRPGVISLGYVADERLPALYRGASAFVFPSWLEGFGIPVVEAMACGVPCVVSSHPSLDEASGDAAVRVDPASPEEIAAGIERALADRDELIRRGLEHAAGFTWRATGEALLAGYREAA